MAKLLLLSVSAGLLGMAAMSHPLTVAEAPVSTGQMIEAMASTLPKPAPPSLWPDPYWDVLDQGSVLWNDLSFFRANGWLSGVRPMNRYTFNIAAPFTREEAASAASAMYGLGGSGTALARCAAAGLFDGISSGKDFTPAQESQFLQNLRNYAASHHRSLRFTQAGRSAMGNPSIASEAGFAQALLNAYSTLPVWPKSLPTNARLPLQAYRPPSKGAWVGLKPVFPDSPPSEYGALLGMTIRQPAARVTAGAAAQWILDWAKTARLVNPAWSGSTNPFSWAETFSVFYGTGVSSPGTPLTSADAQRIVANLVDAARGYRVTGVGKIQFLAPILAAGNPAAMPNTVRSMAETVVRQLKNHTGQSISLQGWSNLYRQAIQAQDRVRIQLTSGGVSYQRLGGSPFGAGSDIQFASPAGTVTGEWSPSVKAINSGNPQVVYQMGYPVQILRDRFYFGVGAEPGFTGPIAGEPSFSYSSAPYSRQTNSYFGVVLRGPRYYVSYQGAAIEDVGLGRGFYPGAPGIEHDYPEWLMNQLG